MQQQSGKKYLLYAFLIVMAILLSGVALGLYYASLPEHHPQSSKSACEKAGGDWVADQALCLISNRVAGEACTDGGQCKSGVCFPPTLTDAQQATLLHEDVSGIIGTCYPDELIQDCVPQVLKGTVSRASLCLND
ncbi:MAG: hypothetical protein WCV86_02605 [Patescibacteria group bacterium]|jgi:hypothetical protein